MTLVAGAHGILNFRYFRETKQELAAAAEAISADWTGWLRSGLGKLSVAIPVPDPLVVAYYADCLDRGIAMGGSNPELLEPFAQEMFVAWVEELRRAETGDTLMPTAQTGRLTRMLVRQSAEYLTQRHGAVATAMVAALSAELATYFGSHHEHRRHSARGRLAEVLHRHRPRVLLAHSLGSVVAYEALCADPSLTVELWVTLGSPLGVPNVVYELLQPCPSPGVPGARPPGVRCWVNIADRGDPVAIPAARLGTRFYGVDMDLEVDIHPVNPHSVKHYLRCRQLAEVLVPYFAYG